MSVELPNTYWSYLDLVATQEAALIDRKPANADMIEGYMDGYDLNAPEPSANRSHSYRHGFMVGRAEKTNNRSAAPHEKLNELADEAMAKDDAQ